MLNPSRCTALKKNGQPCTSTLGCSWISGDSRSTEPTKKRYVCSAHWKRPTGNYQPEMEPVKSHVEEDDDHPLIAFYTKDD